MIKLCAKSLASFKKLSITLFIDQIIRVIQAMACVSLSLNIFTTKSERNVRINSSVISRAFNIAATLSLLKSSIKK